jgi:hypothetical protein
MRMMKIIGLPVLVSARHRIVLDQSLSRLYSIPQDGEIRMQMDKSSLLLLPDTAAAPRAEKKRITIGRFNLPAQWAKKNHVDIGSYIYLVATENGILVMPFPVELAV